MGTSCDPEINCSAGALVHSPNLPLLRLHSGREGHQSVRGASPHHGELGLHVAWSGLQLIERRTSQISL